jgi:dynactin complex subunit
MIDSSKRAQTSPVSRYNHIPTENLKFQRFIDLIFKSRMGSEDVKIEVLKYVQALETNYTDTIRDLQLRLDGEKNKLKKSNFDKVAETS